MMRLAVRSVACRALVYLLASTACASKPPLPAPKANDPLVMVVEVGPAIAKDPDPPAPMTAPRAMPQAADGTLAAQPPPVRQLASDRGLALDNAWGARGHSVLTLGAGETELSGVVPLADGTLYVGGHTHFGETDACVAKLDAAGKLDKKFGTLGFARVGEFGAFGSALAVDAKGRAVLAGYFYKAGATQLLVGRVMPDGQLDPTFGTGGVVVSNFGGNDERPTGIIALANGGTLVVGNHSSRTDDSAYFALFDERGAPDTRFGPKGVAFFDVMPGREFVTRAILGADGSLVLGGYSPKRKVAFVARVHLDGSPDLGFGDRGVTVLVDSDIGSAWALTIDGDGKVLVGGQTRNDTVVIARVDRNGHLDPSFGKGGYLRGPARAGDQVYALFPTASNGIVGVGFRGLANDARSLLLKITPDGKLDTTFGIGGLLLGNARGEYLSAGAVDASGGLVGVGMRAGTKTEQIDGLVMRFAAQP